MKKQILSLILFLTTIIGQSQELFWETSIDKAIEVSNKTNKPMLMFFTGSDWCGWCIRLQKEVLKTPEFATWAKENVVLVELDYPKRTPQTDQIKAQNQQLQQVFGIQGYPTICFANASLKEGKINFEQIGKTGYVAGGPSEWLKGAEEILKNNTKKVQKATKKDKKQAKKNKKK